MCTRTCVRCYRDGKYPLIGIRVGLASRTSWMRHGILHSRCMRIEDVVFEDVVFDHNRFDIDATLTNNL